MASSKDRERELARRRLERRQLREAQQRAARRRAMITVAGTIVAVLAIVGVVALVAGNGDGKKKTGDGKALVAGCDNTKPAPITPQTFPSEPPVTTKPANYVMDMQTNCGDIQLTLDGAKAPHTVNTLKFLADKHYYDGTKCHRLTKGEGLKVLQCGDPNGDGSGGPGYTIAEENLQGATYTRGVVAMAKTSAPHSTGSQLFLVIQDSQLPPQYTVVGHITKGLDILDKILAAGVIVGQSGPDDGAPKQPVYLKKVTVELA